MGCQGLRRESRRREVGMAIKVQHDGNVLCQYPGCDIVPRFYKMLWWGKLGKLNLQFSSVAQSGPTLCDHMDYSTSGFSDHHQLLELTQTHVHWVSDAIQPSHPLSSPSPSHLQSFPVSGSFPVSQLVASGGQSIGVSASASVLPMNIQDWCPLGLTGLISLQSKGCSRVFSNTTVQKHQFLSAQLTLWFNSHIHTWLLEKP